jgi:hypothetical protein
LGAFFVAQITSVLLADDLRLQQIWFIVFLFADEKKII